MKEKIIVEFEWVKAKKCIDLEIPLDITANELLYGLNQGLHLGIHMEDLEQCYLSTENPIVLLQGDTLLSEYGLHNGTKIFFTR